MFGGELLLVAVVVLLIESLKRQQFIFVQRVKKTMGQTGVDTPIPRCHSQLGLALCSFCPLFPLLAPFPLFFFRLLPILYVRLLRLAKQHRPLSCLGVPSLPVNLGPFASLAVAQVIMPRAAFLG